MPNYSATHRFQWSAIEIALLKELHASGFGPDAITNRMGRSRKAISAKLRRVKNPDATPQPNPWTPERVLQLKEDRAAGLSAGLIGRKMGMSRNAVIGKLHRIGMFSPSVVTTSSGHIVTAVNKYKMTRINGSRRSQPRRWTPKSPILQVEEIPDLPADKSKNPIGIYELEPHHCRYPVGTETPVRWFCGDQVAEGMSYCPRHCRIAYRPTPRQDPQERAMRALWWSRQITPSGQSRLAPSIESIPTDSGQPSRAG